MQVVTFGFMVIDPPLALLGLGGVALLAVGVTLTTRRPSAGRPLIAASFVMLGVAAVWALVATWLTSSVPRP